MLINVCFPVNNSYISHLSALMVSIADHTCPADEVRFYVIDGGIKREVRTVFLEWGRGQGYDIVIIDVLDIHEFDDAPMLFPNTPRVVYQRLRLGSLLPKEVEKVLYLDSDMIVQQSLRELYETNIDNYCAAVVAERAKYYLLNPQSHYFNSGMMLLNLKKLRDERWEEKFFDYTRKFGDAFLYHDQDVLNGVFEGNVKFLGLKWNMFLFDRDERGPRQLGLGRLFSEKEIQEAKKNPGIIHFITERKPWLSAQNPYTSVYWKYLKRTPFYRWVDHFRVMILGRLINSIKRKAKVVLYYMFFPICMPYQFQKRILLREITHEIDLLKQEAQASKRLQSLTLAKLNEFLREGDVKDDRRA